jgi:hypothetical protein
MIDIENMQRLLVLHERLRTATYHELKKDGHCKSAEGAMEITISLPNAFEQDRRPTWSVMAYSYILCPEGRSETWFGKTPAEAIGKAEDAINKWLFQSEGEMMGLLDTDSPEEQERPQ